MTVHVSAAFRFLVVACSSAISSSALSADLPTGFVYLKHIAPDIIQDIRYAGTDNFVGQKLDGYQAAECILARPVARALKKVDESLSAKGLSLVVFDCYRPVRAVKMMVRELKKSEKPNPEYYPNNTSSQLITKGYVAARSGHSSGGSVDIGLARGKPYDYTMVDMGSSFDFFDRKSHLKTSEITPLQTENRLLLQRVMRVHGFSGYSKEWWHFRFINEPFRGKSFNFPILATNTKKHE